MIIMLSFFCQNRQSVLVYMYITTRFDSLPPPQPWAVAGHTAVLAGDRMVVVGGVTTPGLRISPRVMVYSVSGDGWEVWQPQELGLLGQQLANTHTTTVH